MTRGSPGKVQLSIYMDKCATLTPKHFVQKYFRQSIFGQINFGHFFVNFGQISDKNFGHFLQQNNSIINQCSDAN